MLKSLELRKGNMVFTASGALRSLKNANLPLNAILVRELIQNSLDAANSDEVCINFKLHNFSNENIYSLFRLNLEENLIKRELLNLIQSKNVTNILELSDKGTKGLTGNIRNKLNSYGVMGEIRNNYFNLIFDITRSQTAEYSGGSYGLGKTIYFLCSELGMVIYYSRCLNDYKNYEHRLIISLISIDIENNLSPNSTGIVWWGSEIIETNDGEHLLALTDNDALNFLASNNLEPYSGSETGTKIFIIGPNKTLCGDENIDLLKELYRNVNQWFWPRILNFGRNSLSKLKIPKTESNLANFQEFDYEFNVLRNIFKENHLNYKSNTWYCWDNKNQTFEILNREVRFNDFIISSVKNKPHGVVREEFVTGFASIIIHNEPNELTQKVYFFRRPGMVLFFDNPILNFIGDHNFIGFFEVNSELQIKYPKYNNIDDIFKACEDPNHHTWNYKSQERLVNQVVGSTLRILRDDLYKFSHDQNNIVSENHIDYNLSRQLGKYLSFIETGIGPKQPTAGPKPTINETDPKIEIVEFLKSENKLKVSLRITNLKSKVNLKFGILEGRNKIPLSKDDWRNKFKDAYCPEYPIKLENVEIINSIPSDQIELEDNFINLKLSNLIGKSHLDIILDFKLISEKYLIGFKIIK